ncbi:MAG: B12-binding domain-containing radical SAM protein [Candidatus Buchananbacteria bacterium]
MKDKLSILLVNPPIYDFAAYDFWLKPLGMLTAAGKIANADFQLFDFLDRVHSFYSGKPKFKNDKWGRGSFYSEIITKPDVFKNVPRKFCRFGLPKDFFIEFLKENDHCDYVFVQTVMTYWYLGYKEVIETVKTYWPKAKIVLGGPYTKICPEHAKSIGADFIDGEENNPVMVPARGIEMMTRLNGVSLWNLYKNPETAAMKITQGCPFKCTYCTVPIFNKGFTARPYEEIIEEFNFIISLGVKNIAFYDDALLYKADEVIKPFLRYVINNKIKINFHTPNALNARFIDAELADLLVRAGFKSFYLGFESRADEFQKQTGAKIFDNEFSDAVKNLVAAGAGKSSITAYLILGHPKFEIQNVEDSMKYVNSLGVRSMLADFSPIPIVADSKLCEKYVDISEPLMHNKTVFPIIVYGADKVNRIKDICRSLNHKVEGA